MFCFVFIIIILLPDETLVSSTGEDKKTGSVLTCVITFGLFLLLDCNDNNRSLTRGLVTAFLVLAGAEEGNEECNYRVVRDNKERPVALFLPYNG